MNEKSTFVVYKYLVQKMMHHTGQNIPAAVLRYKPAIRRMTSWRSISANFSSFIRGASSSTGVGVHSASFIRYHYRLDEGNSVPRWHS